MLSLTSPPVSARHTEKKFTEALNEFYLSFFTGLPHASQLGTATFPPCDLLFNQTQLPAPASKPQIHTAYTDLRHRERWVDSQSKIVFADATLSIFVRVANQGAQGNANDFLCRETADQVKEIFESQDRFALPRLGIRHPRVQRGPVPLPTVGMQVRLIVLTCELQYRIPRTGA